MARAEKNAQELQGTRTELQAATARADKNAQELHVATALAEKNAQELQAARKDLHVATAQWAKSDAKISLRIVWLLKFRLSHLIDFLGFNFDS